MTIKYFSKKAKSHWHYKQQVVWILTVRMSDREEQGRETVTYGLEIPQCNYLPIVELEKQVVFRPELKEEL